MAEAYPSRQVAVGTVRYTGTIGRVHRVGSIVGGSLTTSSRRWAGTQLWDRIHTGAGSTYLGSWQYVGNFYVKTVAVVSTQAGSLFMVVGATGTGPTRLTGTLTRVDLGQGTYHTASFTEALQYMRPIVRVGSIGSGKGSLSVAVLRQA